MVVEGWGLSSRARRGNYSANQAQSKDLNSGGNGSGEQFLRRVIDDDAEVDGGVGASVRGCVRFE